MRRAIGETIATTANDAPIISAITWTGSQLWETPSASELLSACSTMHGNSDPVRW